MRMLQAGLPRQLVLFMQLRSNHRPISQESHLSNQHLVLEQGLLRPITTSILLVYLSTCTDQTDAMDGTMVQWYTAVSVTMPIVVSDTHFQNTISSLLVCDLTFCLVSMLKICNVRPAIGAVSVTRNERKLSTWTPYISTRESFALDA